ncbi:MAG: hypothetical protein H6835_11555 [Planctomycetes bacterium]|nr:hypothetical protein [Planctomycetota bacterium]
MTRRATVLLAALAASLPFATAPVRTQQPTAELARITALLAELDAAFVAGDLAALRTRFEPDHPGAVAMFVHHLEALLRLGGPRERSSEIVAGPHQYGALTLVRVRHSTRWPDAATTPGHPAARVAQPLVEDSYLTVRANDQRLVPTFVIGVPVQVECVKGNRFRCAACNYQIGGVDGWLCVPIEPERGGAIEAASFYLLGTDLSLDVTVRVEPEAVAAAATAERLAAELAALTPDSAAGVTSRWLPPEHEEDPPTGLDGARVAIEIPEDGDGGSRAVLHVVTLGTLQHILLARGSRAALEAHADRLAELLQSYRLLQPDRNLAEAAAMPLRQHTGGWFEATTYHNDHFGVVLRGPAGWKPSQRTGGAVFRVAWTGPDGGRLWLTGHRVPVGMTKWTEADVDRWLTQQCDGRGLELRTAENGQRWRPAPDNWCDAPDGGREQSVELRAVASGDPAAPHHRRLRLLVFPDLLLVADAHAGTERESAALHEALPTLRRGN